MEKYTHVLDNGFTVVLIPNHARPMVEARGWIRAGYAVRSGNATIDSRLWAPILIPPMLARGTKFHSADEFEDLLDDYALQYSIDVSSDSAFFVEWGGAAVKDYEVELLKVIYESLRYPDFKESELMLLKESDEAGLINGLSNPSICATSELLRMLYGPSHHLFRLSVEESIAQLGLVTSDYLRPFYERYYTADRAGIVIAGDINPDIICDEIAQIFGKWDKVDRYRDVPDFDFCAENLYGEEGYEERTLFVPGKPNAVLLVGKRLTITSSHQDYAALRIAVMALGDDMHSRLFRGVREKCGSYSVSAMLHEMRVVPGWLSISADNSPGKILQTQQATLRVLADFHEQGMSEEELLKAKVLFKGKNALYRSSLAGIAQCAVISAIAGRPNYFEELGSKISELTLEEVNSVIYKYLDPSDVKVVRAGTVA